MDAGGTTCKTGIYCRGCDYDLRESALRCPECGRAFDGSNPKTFYASPRSRRVRRWGRRVVLLILLITLPPALGLGWLWWGWNQEQKAIAALKQAGWTAGPSIPMSPWLPRFLPERWGFLAGRVMGVGNPPLSSGSASPPLPREAVRHIAHLTCLRGLAIARMQVTDHDVHELRGLSRLQRIQLTGPGITDRALADLVGMKSMYAIILRDTSIAGPGLRHLATLPRLKSLELIGGAIGDEALTPIGEMKQIQELWMSGVPITDEGMKRLAGLTQLRVLSLEEMKVGDEGLKCLAGMMELKYLMLSATPVTDAGLEHLKGLKKLEVLGLHGVPISLAAKERLRTALPQLNIQGQPPRPDSPAPATAPAAGTGR